MADTTTTSRKKNIKPFTTESIQGKLPPQATDLEEAVLGALMLDKDALASVIDILHPESFYKDQHQKIFGAIHQLFHSTQPVDILTVTQQLRKTGELEIAGGAYYITQLTNRVASAANVEFHARIILQKFIQRELIRISGETIRDAYEETTDVLDLLDRAERNLFTIAEGNIRRNYEDMNSLIAKAIKEVETAAKQTAGVTGVPSGFTELDRITAGWQKSDLIIIAARPGMGKCLGKGTKVLMFDGSLRNVEDVQVGEQLMGDDSSPRNVLSIARGQEAMYWIRQNKGIDYRVNESHILSLKRSRNEGPHNHGDVLNITVKDYLTKSIKYKSNYKGYKVTVEFDEKELQLDPYFLGLWLGDGHSYSSQITNTDGEIIEYMETYATTLDRELVTYKQKDKTPSYSITSKQRGHTTGFSVQATLRELNLLENKHIPQHYLINSTANRLQLLAGLIDSDGHFDAVANGYEITQKNERLAKEIKFLCDSLGFRTSLIKKKASLAGTFICDVYRVRFFGDLDTIPVKVERKKAPVKNTIIDWRVTGIKVEYDKVDDYYGFEIDGNRLFLLEDMTVTHNTAFTLSMARNAAVMFNKPVAFFSCEMSSLQLVNRLISSETEINSEKLKKGQLADHEWAQLNSRISPLTKAPIYIDDTPALTIFELRAKCRRLVAEKKIELIIIDYLQLMVAGTDNGRGGNREQEISTISRSLKSIAKELNIPIIALSQLSRAVESRGGSKKPQLSDLRESGAIEQDADMVMFIYRPEYYGLTEDENNAPTTNIAEIIVAKNRNGALKSVNLKFIGHLTKFTDLDNFDFVDETVNIQNPNVENERIMRTSRMNDMEEEPPF